MWNKKRSCRIIWWEFPRKIGIVLLLAVMVIALWQSSAEEEAVPVTAGGSSRVVQADTQGLLPTGKESLMAVMPTMSAYYGRGEGLRSEIVRWLGEMIAVGTGVRTDNLVSVISGQFPHIQESPVRAVSKTESQDAPIFMPKATGEVRVGIYHTHTAESFVPSFGKSHAAGGECGEIVEVGEFLARSLAEKGVRAVQSKTVHDYPNFMQAYGASEKTATEMIGAYPSLDVLFDIHRDASKRDSVAVTIDGKTAAKVLIVVAQGQDGLPQPHWQENYRLAKAIEQKMEEMYPGLSAGIQLTKWRYNQHLHPHALLLEIGSHETSKGEAMRSMKLFADVLAQLLSER